MNPAIRCTHSVVAVSRADPTHSWVQRAGRSVINGGTVRSDAGSRGLICPNVAHDKLASREHVSLLSFLALLLFFCYLVFMVST